MRVSDLNGILKRQFPGIVWCVVWSITECKALEDGMNSAKVMEVYGDRELTGLYAFDDKVVLEVK